jgi:hypothetical protein
MASIADKIAAIRNAIFGKEVRSSIADGIEAMNDEINTVMPAARQATTDANMAANAANLAATRVNEAADSANTAATAANAAATTATNAEKAVNTIVGNENTRISAENIRIENENGRKTFYDLARVQYDSSLPLDGKVIDGGVFTDTALSGIIIEGQVW